MLFNLSIKIFLRELKSGQLVIMFMSLVLAVTSVASISIFTDRLEGALSIQTQEFLGGDLKFESNQTLSDEILERINNEDVKISKFVQFASMLSTKESIQFASIKAVDNNYPLTGQVELLSPKSKDLLLINGPPNLGTIWMEKRLLNLLELELGDLVDIGKSQFFVSNILISEPDRGSNSYSFAPKVVMNSMELPKTNIIQPGSRVRYSYIFLSNSEKIKLVKDELEEIKKPTDRITEVGSNEGSLGRTINRSKNFFLLGAILAVIIASFTIGIGSQRFTRRHVEYVTIFKVLGATLLEVRIFYALIFFWLSFFGIFFGLVFGWFAQDIFATLLSEYFPKSLPSPTLKPFFISSVTVIICLIGFAYPNLVQLINIPPSTILHRNKNNLVVGKLNFLLILFAIFLLLFFYTENMLISGMILTGIGIISLLSLVIILTIFRDRNILGLGLSNPSSLAWSELHKRKNSNATQVLAFTVAMGISLMVFVLKSDLVNTWESSISKDSPNYFAINITKNEISRIKNFLRKEELDVNTFYPITSIRLNRVSDSPKNTLSVAEDSIERSFNVTWSYKLPKENKIISGKWFSNNNINGLSLSKEISDRYNLEVGDEVFVTSSNNKFKTFIQSIREVNWDNFSPNFFVIGPPSLFKDTISTHITSFYVADSKSKVMTKFLKNFKTVSFLSLDSIIRQVKGIINQASQALSIILLLTLISAMFLIVATIQDSFNLRIHQSAVLRTLGVGSSFLQKATILEFSFLGFLSGFLGASFAQLGLYFLEIYIFEIVPKLHLSIWILGPLIGTILVTSISLVLVFFMARHNPKEILFNS